jgi:methionyl-tRNA formyltransferase
MCKDLAFRLLKWLVAHQPDNRTHKHRLRLSNVHCGQGLLRNSVFVISDDYKPLLTIGDRVAISTDSTAVCASARKNSRVAMMLVGRDQYIKSAPVVIGDDSWVGASDILLPSVEMAKENENGKGDIIDGVSVIKENISGGGGSSGCPSESHSISQAQLDTTSWVVLFGGAGRQNVISYMQANGFNVIKVIVPAKRSQRLDEAVIHLRDKEFDVSEVIKDNLAASLNSLSAYPLLSLGFPHIVPKEVFEKHPLALNVHPTLLPKYRGPSSGAYILINGEEKSGSTVHLMVDEVDKGPILLQREVALSPFDTVRSMQQKVYGIEPQLVVDAIELLHRGGQIKEQDEDEASIYPKPRKPEDSIIDPLKPLVSLINEIRACDHEDYPAHFYYFGEKVCIRLWRPDKEDDYDTL